MSYQDSYVGKPVVDEYDQHGNQNRRQTDEYGNPIHHGGGATGVGGYGATNTYGGGDQFQPQKHHDQGQDRGHGGVTGVLHRSGSSSSSSSEDDGQGGRRKKGMKDKIKEKLPGGHKEQQQQTQYPSSTTTPAGGGYVDESGQYHEKKGMMDKIKEKLPGGQH